MGRKLILSITGLLIALSLSAQTIRITGTVFDGTGQPLAGTGVLIKGTSSGTATDLDGHYIITAPVDAILVFSCLG